MNGARTRTITAALVVGLALLAWRAAPPDVAPPAHATAEVAALARRWNIRNLVTAIYLGPRAADTFLEVMVVTLAVVGLRALGEP
ncbi:MAG: hypothetical protein N2652_10235 [Kiritimatiellae bacterium]|nr:hypothetical protein [Kiritimatiellia bacterium]